MSDDKPTIDVQEGGPLLVKGLQKLTDSRDRPIKTVNKVIVLCRQRSGRQNSHHQKG